MEEKFNAGQAIQKPGKQQKQLFPTPRIIQIISRCNYLTGRNITLIHIHTYHIYCTHVNTRPVFYRNLTFSMWHCVRIFSNFMCYNQILTQKVDFGGKKVAFYQNLELQQRSNQEWPCIYKNTICTNRQQTDVCFKIMCFHFFKKRPT